MLKIITYPNEILRKPSEEVSNPTSPQIKQLISDMVATMRANEGAGLAAPQVGQNIKLCVIEIEDELFVLINPVIKTFGGKKIINEEGCLSFPGKFFPVERFDRVKVKAIDANGKKQIIHARGLLARALQHEIDHLEGTLFIDRTQKIPENEQYDIQTA